MRPRPETGTAAVPTQPTAAYAALVAECITDHLTRTGQRLTKHSPAASVLIDAVGAQVGFGKLVRPQLVNIAWLGFGGAPAATLHCPPVVAGAAIEYFQAAALIQDDVFDASETRRGKPATHKALEATHTAHNWRGRSNHFGEVSAILASDLCLVWSETLFNELNLDVTHPARRAFDSMRETVTLGQFLDFLVQVDGFESCSGATGTPMVAPFDAAIDSQELRAAMTVIQNKTVSYTTVAPLRMGAALAGATENQLEQCDAIAVPFGTAYQLRDDLLGVFGDSAVTGKPAGDDIREGKETALVAIAGILASENDRQTLRQHLGTPDLTSADLDRVKHILQVCGAVDIVEAKITELHDATRAAIESSDLAETAQRQLKQFAESISQRTS